MEEQARRNGEVKMEKTRNSKFKEEIQGQERSQMG